MNICLACKIQFHQTDKRQKYCTEICRTSFYKNKALSEYVGVEYNKIENLYGEIWVDMFGKEEYYQISNYGRVKSKEYTYFNFRGQKYITKPECLNKITTARGYSIVTLSRGYIKTYKLHRLIAIAFIPNPENKPYINHKNGIRNDNRIENLEWCTPLENLRHAIDTGLMVCSKEARAKMSIARRGEKCPLSKLKEVDIIPIRELYKNGVKTPEIASKYNVTKYCIKNIIYGRAWKHVK